MSGRLTNERGATTAIRTRSSPWSALAAAVPALNHDVEHFVLVRFAGNDFEVHVARNSAAALAERLELAIRRMASRMRLSSTQDPRSTSHVMATTALLRPPCMPARVGSVILHAPSWPDLRPCFAQNSLRRLWMNQPPPTSTYTRWSKVFEGGRFKMAAMAFRLRPLCRAGPRSWSQAASLDTRRQHSGILICPKS